jgi:hypothetical protein
MSAMTTTTPTFAQRFLEWAFGPTERDGFTPPDEWAPVMRAEEPPADPALAILVERVLYATHGWVFDRADVEIIVHEALWQAGHLIRQGARVEVPALGTFQRRAAPLGSRIDYQPDPDLLGSNHA